LTTLALASVVN